MVASAKVRFFTRKLRSPRVLVIVVLLVVLWVLLPVEPPSLFRPGQPRFVHPIDRLLEDAQQQWAAKLARQSKTLKQAVTEYKRRYGRPPPKDFDRWFAFATDASFKLIDEFDPIDEDLALFRYLSSSELRSRTRQAMLQETTFGVVLESGKLRFVDDVREGGVKRGAAIRATGFVEMVEPIAHLLPDMMFALNAFAEAAVFPPWERVQTHNMSLQIPDLAPYLTPRNGYASWYHFTNSCHPASYVRHHPDLYQWPLPSGILPPQTGLNSSALENGLEVDAVLQLEPNRFLAQTEAYDDFCQVSPQRFYEYGAFYSGISAFTEVVPIFSPGRMAGSVDIRIPSSFYAETWDDTYSYGYNESTGKIDLNNPSDSQWEDKRNTIYWRGRDVSGANSPAQRFAFHPRHRLVQIASQSSDLVVPFLQRAARSCEIVVASVDYLRSTVLDFAFTSLAQCNSFPGKCEQKKRDYLVKDGSHLNEQFRSKLIFDIDGMGYSGRFLALLTSRSVALKATVYREFFEDWLQPWVHYVPVSMHFSEIFNIWAYFLDDPTGQGERALQKIAEDSRETKLALLQQVNLEIYLYRLSLEWARLWYADTEDMDYH